MRKRIAIMVGVVTCLGTAEAQTEEEILSMEDLADAYVTRGYTRQSVHDPSIVVDTITKAGTTTYYVFGSHVAGAKTTNLASWSWVGAGENTTTTNSWFGTLSEGTSGEASRCSYANAYETNVVTKVKNYAGEEVDFGNYSAHDWQYTGYTVKGNQWAPDVIYNPTMGKWLMYMSVNGDKWCSSIVCLASDAVTGPYVYQGPVVFSGFQGTYTHVGFEASKDYKHTDLEIALGEQTSLPTRYAASSSWGTYWPNCIDPCVFYDDEGNLMMSYGSWSGGIFLLHLDETTGLRDYTHTYSYKVNGVETTPGAANANCTEDPYFGIKIAGGYYVSGEASYIEKIGDYYFLFMSYGGLEAAGGYQMRVFRSANPEGPYVDCQGNKAIYTSYQKNYASNSATNRGMLLFYNYKWDTMKYAEVAQGHNSATTDDKGRSMVVFHTRTNDGTEGHTVRTHQLWLNEDKWIVASPYEINDEEIQTQDTIETRTYSATEMAGSWQMLRHTYCLNTASKAYNKPFNIELTADGKATSEGYTGTWAMTEGTSYITVTLNNVEYKGVVVRQVIDNTKIPALCIAALSSTSGTYTNTSSNTKGVMLWGSKADTKAALKYTLDNLSGISDGQQTQINLSLPSSGLLGTSIEWATSDPDIISSDGVIGAAGTATLTLSVKKDGYVVTKEYTVTVKEADETTTAIYYPECGGTTATATFFTQFTPMYTLEKGSQMRFRFYNYNDGATSYDNWVMYCNNLAPGSAGYTASSNEYFAIRPDKYGWGNYYETAPTCGMSNFTTDMNGALVDLTVSYDGNTVSVNGTITTAAGKEYAYKFTSKSGLTDDSVLIFFTVEKSYMVGAPIDDTPVREIKRADGGGDDAAYDLTGRRVGDTYRGLQIRGGRLEMKK